MPMQLVHGAVVRFGATKYHEWLQSIYDHRDVSRRRHRLKC